MKVEGTEAISAPQNDVFRLITDPEVLKRAVPGCESLEVQGDGLYNIFLKAGVGSIKGAFEGTIRVEDVRVPEHLRMIVDVKGKVGFVKGAGDISLAESEESNESTLVTYSGDVTDRWTDCKCRPANGPLGGKDDDFPILLCDQR